MNKLTRSTGPFTYRLLAVEDREELLVGRTAPGRSLRTDIRIARGAGMKLLYSVFVRPRGADL